MDNIEEELIVEPIGGQYPNGVTLKIEEGIRSDVSKCHWHNVMYIVDGNAKGMKPEWSGLNGHVWTIHDNHNVTDTSRIPTNTTGYQYLLLSDGTIHRRRGHNIGYYGGTPNHLATWDNWQDITPRAEGNLRYYNTTPIRNANEGVAVTDFSYQRTNESTGGLDGIPNDRKAGMLLTIIEEQGSRKRGIQILYSVTAYIYKRWWNNNGLDRGPWELIGEGNNVYKHNNTELTGNIDNYNSLGSQKYRNVTSTPPIPNNHGQGYGTVFYIPEHHSGSEHKGMQLLNSTTHQCLYYRTSNESGSWQQWHRIATGTDAILKPEAQPKYTTADLNDIKKTCIYKVSGDNGNRPVASSEGIVQTLAGDNNRYSQIWYGVSGIGNNRVFFRSFNDGRWYNWKEIATVDSIQQQTIQETFRHNPQRIDNVKTIMHSGYYHTTQSTLHLPTQIDDNASKEGVLLVIKKDTKLHYEYTPIAGKYKNQMYIGDFDSTLRVGDPINWYKVSGAEGHIKVHDTRSTQQILPQEYYQHTDSSGSGYIVYEWKWSSDIQLQNIIQGHQNDDILLMTIIPVSKDQVTYDTLINQKAYDLKTHRTFVRNSTKQTNNWSEWTEIGAGGQAIPPIKVNTNIQTPLVNMFKAWANYYKNFR